MKKPTKKQELKVSEDRINGNLGAVYSENKDLIAALYATGFDRASERLARTNHLLLVARAEFARTRRTKPTPQKDPDLKRLHAIENAAQGWSDAIAERRRAGVTPNHPHFKRYMGRIVSAGKVLRDALRAK